MMNMNTMQPPNGMQPNMGGGFYQAAMQQQGGGMPGGMPRPPISMGMPPQMQNMAAQGRFGDTMMAHMTPGEIAVPPQVQTPKVLATLNNAFQQNGVSPQQFTAGHPQSSVNPNTGAPEFSFFSSFLPIALSLAGNAIAPGVGSALGATMSPAALSAIGSGLGATAGGLIAGQDPMQAILSGAGSGAGGYLLGQAFNPAAEAAKEATTATASGASAATPAMTAPNLTAGDLAFTRKAAETALSAPMPPSTPAPTNSWNNLWGMMPKNSNIASMIGGGLGGYIGSELGKPTPITKPTLPRGFNDRMTPVGELPPWDVMLGQNTYRGPTPDFTGYNPYAPNAASFRFYR